jgi:allantoate deiminase
VTNRLAHGTSRLADDLSTVSAFSADAGRITRLAWSPSHLEACRWLVDQLAELGMNSTFDAAGNVIGRWGSGPEPALAVGSHLDSVPDAGPLDGTLGVLSGLEAIRRLQADGFVPRRPVWLIAFMDEEGARFGTPLFGSRAFVGNDVGPMLELVDDTGVSVAAAMAAAGFDAERIGDARAADRIGVYVELHIEQGPVLEAAGADIGVVTAIAGGAGLSVRMTGMAAHAGTTPMDLRRDALVGAARAVLALRDEARAAGDIRVTVGRLAVEPGGTNVVPGACQFIVDLRAFDRAVLDEARGRLTRLIEHVAADEGLEVTIEPLHEVAPLGLDEGVRAAIARAAAAEDAEAIELPSGAGHDALVVGRVVPAGMIFVPSQGGISHHPAERTAPEHCEIGVRVLARTIRELAG